MYPISNATQIGATLASRRKHLKLTQTEVAEKLSLSQNRLSELEANPGTMTVEQLLALANALGLELRLGERPASGKPKVEW
jgi:HTH-type transcriptional regulator/antitoxin HipB